MSTIFTSSTQLRCSEAQVETFLARPRNTLSARSMNAKQAAAVATTLAASQQLAPSGEALAPAPSGAEQLRAIFCGLDLKKQDQVRLLAYQRIVLEAKMAAMLERLEGRHAWGTEEGDLDMGSGGSEALSRLQRAVDDSQGELVRAVGARVTRDVLRAIWAPDMQEALKLSIMSEEESREKLASTHDEYVALQAAQEQGVEALRGGGSVATRGAANLFQAQERAARLWRRRLWKITIPVRIDAKLRWATAHDDYDNRGRRSLVNDLNRRRPEDHMSYYQVQAQQYGRTSGRRGSTTISGLFQQVLDQEKSRALEEAGAGAVNESEEERFLRQVEEREAAILLELEALGGGAGAGAQQQQQQQQHYPQPPPQHQHYQQQASPWYEEGGGAGARGSSRSPGRGAQQLPPFTMR